MREPTVVLLLIDTASRRSALETQEKKSRATEESGRDPLPCFATEVSRCFLRAILDKTVHDFRVRRDKQRVAESPRGTSEAALA